MGEAAEVPYVSPPPPPESTSYHNRPKTHLPPPAQGLWAELPDGGGSLPDTPAHQRQFRGGCFFQNEVSVHASVLPFG